MYCTIDKFKNEFPTLNREENNISSLSDADLNKVIQWTNTANTQAREQGFDKELFRVEWKRVDAITGHANHRNNTRKVTLLHVNTENINEYDSFIENELLVQLHEMQFLDESITEEIEDANIISEEALQSQEDRIDYQYGDVLFSPVTYDSLDDSDINDNPVNFREWKETRLNLLTSLNRIKSKLLTKKEDKGKIKQINKAIKDLETEIADFDDTDPNYVHENIINEIDSLNTLLNLNQDDPVQAANILDTNLIRERINDLETAFFNEKLGGEMYLNFHNGLDNNQIWEIKAKIKELDNKYKGSLESLIFNIIDNNELMLQHKQHFISEGREAELDEFVDRVKQILDPTNNNYKADGDSLFGKNFLGAGSYDSVLAEIVLITRDINKSKEAGITNLWRKQLKDSYDKIKFVKTGNEFFIDKLFQKDEFGVKTQKLLNYITPNFYGKIKILSSANREFYTAKIKDKGLAYKDWMTLNKMNVDYIQSHKVKSFMEKYKDNPDFKEFFKYSQAEMEAYEKEMRDQLGDVAFELELEKQTEAITNYLNDEFTTSNDKYHKNPLRYLENFYSDNFDKYDSTTGDFILPNYLKFIPSLNDKSYYNQEFRNVENLNVNGFKDFYTSAKNLLDYTRETARAEGVEVNFNDIISLRDSAGREAKKNLSTFGGMWLDVKAILKNLFSEFYEGRLENSENDKDYQRKFNTHYSNYGFREIDQMTEVLARKDYSELKEIANKEGISVPDKYKDDSVYNRAKLANSIARNRINQSTSLDLFKRISYGATLAESINTRRNTMSILGVIKDYTKENNVENTESFLNVWEANNILQPGYLNHEFAGKIERVKMSAVLPKIYTEAEQQLKKLYEDEKKNINGKYNFTKDGNRYYSEKGKYYKEDIGAKTVNETNKSEVDKEYETYIEGKISELGKNARVGTFMFGLAWNMFRSYLWTSLPSGLKNRMAGYNQNNEAASSNLYGFNMDNLVSARKLLGGTNIRKTINYTGLPKAVGIPNTKKAQQVDILMNLVESLGLLENVMNDIDAGDGSGSFIGEEKYNNFKEFMSDFAMNNPEFHNQMEILVAMMQNVEITKVDGSKGTLYDPKTRSFPYDPKTMKLLPEYRTEENIKNWEQYIADDNGNAPQNLMIQKYINIKHKLHGNYRSDDKIAIQSTMTGRGLTAFMKWAYENLNNQYGGKKVSLATAQLDVKGRKIPIITRFPLLGTHLLMQNVGIPSVVGTTIGLVTGTTPIILTGLGIANAGILGYLMIKNRKNIKFSVDDFGTSFNYMKEILLRSIKTTTLTSTRGLVNPISDATIEKWTGREEASYKNRNLNFKERQLISESAQEVANKYNMAFQFMITGLVLKALYTMVTASPGDDEEDKMKKLEGIEGTLKFLTNTKNQLTSDMEKWTSPSKVKDTYDQIILLRFVLDSYNKVIQAPQKFEEGKISEEEMYYNMVEGASGPLLGTPKQLLKIFHPNKKMYSDDRIYDNDSKTWADDYLLNSHLTGEAKFKPLVGQERKKLRLQLESVYRKKLRTEFDKQGRSDYENMDDIIKQNIDSKLRDNNTYVDKTRNNEDIYKNTDWNAILKSAEKDEVTTTLKEKGSGGNKSTKGSRSKSSRGKRKGSDD